MLPFSARHSPDTAVCGVSPGSAGSVRELTSGRELTSVRGGWDSPPWWERRHTAPTPTSKKIKMPFS